MVFSFRWLQPGDSYAVVLNQQLAKNVGGGDTVTFHLGVEGEVDWQVVGLLFDPIITRAAHGPRTVLLHELGDLNRAATIWIQTEETDADSESAVARAFRAFYRQQNLRLNAGSVFNQSGLAD